MTVPTADRGALAAMTPVMHRVRSRANESVDTVTLELEPIGPAIERPHPGQFAMLWAFGVGEAPISMAGILPDGRLVHTIRRVGAVTSALGDAAIDDQVGVRGPFGTGWDLDRAEGGDLLVVAGGLGVAPVRSLIERVLETRDRFRRVAVVLGARSPDLILYPADIARWHERRDLDLEVTVDVADSSWRGNVGVVTQLLDRAPIDIGSAAAFICGPEVMMRFAGRALLARGADPDRIEVSLERNMHCAIGHCGHCQLGPLFVCKDGPVQRWTVAGPLLAVPER